MVSRGNKVSYLIQTMNTRAEFPNTAVTPRIHHPSESYTKPTLSIKETRVF